LEVTSVVSDKISQAREAALKLANQSTEFPYALEELGDESDGGSVNDPSATSLGLIWSLHNGKHKADHTPVSVLICDLRDATESIQKAALNTVEMLKRLNHDTILSHIHSQKLGETWYLVVERIRPLLEVIIEIRQNPDELLNGVRQLLNGLVYLHRDVALVHGTLSIESIAITPAGDWRIGGFEAASSLESLIEGKSIMDSIQGLPLGAPRLISIAPEVLGDCWTPPPWGVDTWGASRIMSVALDGAAPPTLSASMDAMAGSEVKKRPPPERILEDTCFSKEYIEGQILMEGLSEASESEREALYQLLSKFSYPLHVLEHKVVPALLKEVSGGSVEALRPLVDTVEALRSDSVFVKRVLPALRSWLGRTSNRGMWTSVLLSLEPCVASASPSQLQDIIPQILLGIADPAPAVREATVRALGAVLPKASEGEMKGTTAVNKKINLASALQALLQLLRDEVPEIRTNAAVAIGKVASSLELSLFGDDPSRALRPIFKSLNDDFTPLRKESLVVVGVTARFLSNTELATVVVPLVSPKLVDPDFYVRKTAYTTMEMLMERLNPTEDPWDMRIKDLKEELRAAGVDYAGCSERQELVDLWLRATQAGAAGPE